MPPEDTQQQVNTPSEVINQQQTTMHQDYINMEQETVTAQQHTPMSPLAEVQQQEVMNSQGGVSEATTPQSQSDQMQQQEQNNMQSGNSVTQASQGSLPNQLQEGVSQGDSVQQSELQSSITSGTPQQQPQTTMTADANDEPETPVKEVDVVEETPRGYHRYSFRGYNPFADARRDELFDNLRVALSHRQVQGAPKPVLLRERLPLDKTGYRSRASQNV